MSTLRVSDILKDKVLISREAARLLEQPLRASVTDARSLKSAGDTISATVDFAGIEGIAPSFLDELLSIFESFVGTGTSGGQRSLMVGNPPTRLSLKFEAVARGHGMSIRAMPDGSWLLTGAKADDV
jgi:hypothetical protein